jgi:hypothetical protein
MSNNLDATFEAQRKVTVAAAGPIDAAAPSVDKCTSYLVRCTAPANTILTLPNPTANPSFASGDIAEVVRVGCDGTGNSFTMYGINIPPNTYTQFRWNGTIWEPLQSQPATQSSGYILAQRKPTAPAGPNANPTFTWDGIEVRVNTTTNNMEIHTTAGSRQVDYVSEIHYGYPYQNAINGAAGVDGTPPATPMTLTTTWQIFGDVGTYYIDSRRVQLWDLSTQRWYEITIIHDGTNINDGYTWCRVERIL